MRKLLVDGKDLIAVIGFSLISEGVIVQIESQKKSLKGMIKERNAVLFDFFKVEDFGCSVIRARNEEVTVL